MAKETDVSLSDVLLQIAQGQQQIAALLAQGRGDAGVHAALDGMTKTLAELATRTRPENPEHTRVSAFNPKGLRDHERPQLKTEFWWVGFPETPETLTDEEIVALNTLVPGAYVVTKGNGNRIPFTVTAKEKLGGGYERLEVNFPCKGEHSTDHRSKLDYIREAMGEAIPTVSDLMAEVRRLRELTGVAV